MRFKIGDPVEVTNPDFAFGFREGDTGTVYAVHGAYVHIEDEDGYCFTHHQDELTIRPA